MLDFECSPEPCVEALDAGLSSLGAQHQGKSNNQLELVTEPHNALGTMQGVLSQPPTDLNSFIIPHSVPWHQPDLSPSLCNTSASSDAPTTHSSASSGHEKECSHSSTSSPTCKVARLTCDFCEQGLDDVDSLCSHLISSHVPSSPFHCGRKRCNKTFKDNRSLKRHLT